MGLHKHTFCDIKMKDCVIIRKQEWITLNACGIQRYIIASRLELPSDQSWNQVYKRWGPHNHQLLSILMSPKNEWKHKLLHNECSSCFLEQFLLRYCNSILVLEAYLAACVTEGDITVWLLLISCPHVEKAILSWWRNWLQNITVMWMRKILLVKLHSMMLAGKYTYSSSLSGNSLTGISSTHWKLMKHFWVRWLLVLVF